jgi:hypothetical protein
MGACQRTGSSGGAATPLISFSFTCLQVVHAKCFRTAA